MNHMKRISASLVCVAAIGLAGHPQAYSTSVKWGSNSVVFYANPSNLDLDATSAENALKTGLNTWSTDAGTPFRYVYGGRVNDTNTGNDGRNVIVFRNASDGGALATTYTWWMGSSLTDSDIIVWDGAYTFFSGTSGCSGGAYLEDVITHELGHALGLNHSSDTAATMYPSYSYCSTEMRSLAADDIAGAQALYGRATTSSTNTAPSISISSPAANSTFNTTSSITFAATANDTQDGNLTSRILWSSSLIGQIGVGGSFSTLLPAGTHVVTATVTDSGALSASKSVTFTVVVAASSPTPTASPTLTASGYRVNKKNLRTDLTWAGFTTVNVDIYRNGSRVTSTTNDGFWTDALRNGGTYRYKACNSGTSTCSNEVSVTF